MKIRCSLNEEGTYVPRKFRLAVDATVVLTGTNTRMELLLEKTPVYLKRKHGELAARGIVVLALLNKISRARIERAPDEVQVSLSAALLKLGSEEVLRSPRDTNWLMDSHVSHLLSMLQSLIFSSPSKAESASILKKLWFEDEKGKDDLGFLRYPGTDQWLNINQRFTELTDSEEAAIDQADVREAVTGLRLLNKHHGQILGITQITDTPEDKSPTKEERAEAMDAFHDLMSQIIVFANLAWSTDETAEHKKTLLSPYMDRVIKNNQKAASRQKKQTKSEPKKDSDPDMDTMYPTE